MTDEVDIEAIMQDIRRQILERRLPGAVQVPLSGRKLPPAFYEHLYEASLIQSQLGVKMNVTKSAVPLIGGLIDRVRAQFHQLVIFYVGQVAAQQAQVNNHLLQALAALGEYVETEE